MNRGASAQRPVLRQAILFLAAGGLNTCFGYAAFAVCLWATRSKELAVVLGTAAGVAFNFATYGAVFSRTGFARLPHFIAFYTTVLAANIVLLRLLTSSGMNAYLAQAVFILFSTPISFVTMRTLVFPKPAEARSRGWPPRRAT